MKITETAQAILDRVNNGEEINELAEEYPEIENWSCGDGFDYALYNGGYLKPEDIVHSDDLEKVKEAIKIVGELKDVWEKISIEF